MQARPPQWVVPTLALTVLVALGACGDDDDAAPAAGQSPAIADSPSVAPTPTPAAQKSTRQGVRAEFGITRGTIDKVVGPFVVERGQNLILVMTADAIYEVHVHGVDIHVDTVANKRVTKKIKMGVAAGTYEVETGQGELLFEVEVVEP